MTEITREIITDLLPVYSFNGEGLWLAKTRTGNDKHVGHSSRLGPWRDVIARISDEYTSRSATNLPGGMRFLPYCPLNSKGKDNRLSVLCGSNELSE